MAIHLARDDGLAGSFYLLTTAKYTIDVNPIFLPHALQHEADVGTTGSRKLCSRDPPPDDLGSRPADLGPSAMDDYTPTTTPPASMTSVRRHRPGLDYANSGLRP